MRQSPKAEAIVGWSESGSGRHDLDTIALQPIKKVGVIEGSSPSLSANTLYKTRSYQFIPSFAPLFRQR